MLLPINQIATLATKATNSANSQLMQVVHFLFHFELCNIKEVK